MARTKYVSLNDGFGFYFLMASLGGLILAALGATWYMEHNGHIVTGMTNQIVWGLPHVFAIFLIVSASGALNVASVGSVFGRKEYKPMGRLSGLLAIALLVGGLAVLVLDLGRPDRLIVAMTVYNFKSIFAWNIFLYIGFLLIVAAYLFVQMNRGTEGWTKPVGTLAFVWRLALTTGTGSIFGWLVARQAYDAAVMAPLFIAMSLSLGTAFFLLVLIATYGLTGRPLGSEILNRLAKLMGVFIAVVLYFTAIQHLTALYAAEHGSVERFILLDGGIYTQLFWGAQVLLGGFVPMLMVFTAMGKSRFGVALASLLVILGGIAQIYVIIIGGQAYPLVLFPGKEVVSGFYDGVINSYIPSLPELVLGIGGIAIALAVLILGMTVLRFIPASLADNDTGAN